MMYPVASGRGINRNKFLIAANSGRLNSFIPMRFAIDSFNLHISIHYVFEI